MNGAWSRLARRVPKNWVLVVNVRNSQRCFSSNPSTKPDEDSSTNDAHTMPVVSPSAVSFHRRVLPETCVALSSQKGRDLFGSAHKHGGLASFFPLMEQFVTQSEPAYCGISTLVMTLNALAVDPNMTWKGPWRWYEESMLNCIDLDEAKYRGITLPTFVCLAKCQGLHTEAHLASARCLDDLRQAVKEACLDNHSHQPTSKILIASYDRKALGQTGSGHFSPIAAYDPVSDCVLILDVARFKYGPHWVSLSTLYEAMLPHDPDTHQSRGYVFLSYPNSESSHAQLLPQSVLLESSSTAESARSKYQDYILNLPQVTLSSVVDYWLKDGLQGETVWDILRPKLLPADTAQRRYANDVFGTLRQMVNYAHPNSSTTPQNHGERCRRSFDKRLPMRPLEAIYILYLASITSPRDVALTHYNAISTNSANCPLLVEQILMEAELVRWAMGPPHDCTPECSMNHDHRHHHA